MTERKPLHQIIERVPALKKGKDVGYLLDTINLEESIEEENREETVRLYYFANTLKIAFEEILMAFSEPIGRGFWLTAEYGVGKSHFLATLACLLSDNSDKLWGCVHNEEIKNFQFQFKKRRLFPVIAGLRGKTAISQDRQITLLDQLEKEIDESIIQLGLEDKINITPVAETLELFDSFDPSLKGAIQSYIQQKSNTQSSELRKKQPELFADYVRRFFKKSNIPFEPKYSINDRLLYLYKQIVDTDNGFNGILFVIDEFEAWLAQRPISSQEGMFDSNVLQALTEILPKQYNCEIYTVIASQTDIPAQLQGRFKSLPLLTGSGAERDYHVICAHRVRRYKSEMEPEAKLYYHNFYNEFSCYKAETEDSFLETFPFHPLSYEAVRRFTSSVQDMPGVRLGLNIFYDVMKSEEALNLTKPITLFDTYRFSSNLQNTLVSPRFSDIQNKYRDSIELIPKIFEDEEDQTLGEAILTILYLQYVISGEQTTPMRAAELADATLTFTRAITGEQRILVLLGEMSGRIPQLEFDSSQPNNGARFLPKQTGPTPQQLIEREKEDFLQQEVLINSTWEKLLYASPAETRGHKALFSGSTIDKAEKDEVVVNQISYSGEILITNSWRPDLGAQIQDAYTHFRLIYLLHAGSFAASDIKDPSIVVIEAAPLGDKLKDLCASYLAVEKVKKDHEPQKQKGPEASEIYSYSDQQSDNYLLKIIQSQYEPFQKGKAHTRDGINLDVLTAMTKVTPNLRHTALLRPTLENAYPDFLTLFSPDKITKPIVSTDARNLVLGFVQGDTSKAVTSTLEQKAVGLGLSLPEDPRRLNPQNSKLFIYLDERLSKNPAITLWSIIKELTGNSYGVPAFLLTAMLLIYVRYRNVPSPVEIQLHPNHNLTNLSNQRITTNRITRANVVELRWQSGIEKYFDTLVAVSGPDWNNIQPYAKLIFPEARIATYPQDIDREIENFLLYLKNQLPYIQSILEDIEMLGIGLDDTISSTDKELLENFIEVYSAEDLEIFNENRELIHSDLGEFKEAVNRLNSLRELSTKSTQTLQLYNTLRDADTGDKDELQTNRELLLPRYKLSSMIGNQTYTVGLMNDTETFIKKLNNAQEVHEKRNLDGLKKLRESISLSKELLDGLETLNKLENLGPPQGYNLADQLEAISNEIEIEITGESKKHRELSYKPPIDDGKIIHHRIKDSFEARLGILRNQLEKAVQEKGKKDNIKTLLNLIQLSKLKELTKKLTPAMIETIQKILEEMRTQVVRSDVIERLIDKFSSITEDDIDKFLAELKTLIKKEFSDKTQAEKKIILTFK